MQATLLVFVGGGAGAALRHLANRLGLALLGPGFPWWTLAVNVVGSLAIGYLAGALSGSGAPIKLLLVTGLLGGFTTFSAFSLDTITLVQRGEALAALGYVASTVVLSIGAAALGLVLAR